jgi:2,4-dienoyl-CoA reductase-like NADH-dependent reductase (Old Yellow Enzyme family)
MTRDPLLQPFRLKHLTLKNRIMSTAHEPSYAEDGLPKDRYRLYHVEKAKGGIALTMTAGSAVVAEDSPPAFGSLHAYKDEIVPWLRRLADDCHEHGAAVMIQITHLGRRTSWNPADWLPVLAASPIREPAHRSFPKEARGLGHRASSRRTAPPRRACRPPGSMASRSRPTATSWTASGRRRPIAARMAMAAAWTTTCAPRSRCWVRCVPQSARSSSSASAWSPTRTGRLACRAKRASRSRAAGEVRSATKFPVFHAARINDVATARHAIASGKLDMVGMTRAHLADPHIARKVADGREQDIRPCVGATYCLDRIYEGRDALCIHNPATGREAIMPHVIARGSGPCRKVVVVGAGPAGLEAARVAAARGHEVVLLGAADQPGGQIRLAARARRRSELLGIAEWRAAQCEKHGVAMRFNRLADIDDVLAEDPQVVIVATGGLPDTAIVERGQGACRLELGYSGR